MDQYPGLDSVMDGKGLESYQPTNVPQEKQYPSMDMQPQQQQQQLPMQN